MGDCLGRRSIRQRALARGDTAGERGTQELRATRDRLVAGELDLHRDGYGFVRPNGSTNRDDDLFIPPNELNGAMQGDEVLVDEAPPGRDGRRSGRIARVLTRRNPTVVGIFHYARAQAAAEARGTTFRCCRGTTSRRWMSGCRARRAAGRF